MLFLGRLSERKFVVEISIILNGIELTPDSAISLAEDYNLELSYRKPFADVWKEENDDPILGPLSERMGVREKGRGPLLVSEEEMEAASESS
jgi:hypothetical protein